MTDKSQLGRRAFLTRASVGGAAAAAGAALAAPAIAQDQPTINWRMASSFPKSLDTIYGSGVDLATRLQRSHRRQVRHPGLRRGRAGAGAAGHRRGHRWHGRMRATRSAITAGARTQPSPPAPTCRSRFSARAKAAYNYEGGGIDIYNEFLQNHNLVCYPVGNTGAQMGGWYRKEINSRGRHEGPEDADFGPGGQGRGKVGRRAAADRRRRHLSVAGKGHASTRPNASAPMTTKSSGSRRWRRTTIIPASGKAARRWASFVNLDKWNELPDTYKSLFRTCCQATDQNTLARYDYKNPAALKRTGRRRRATAPVPAGRHAGRLRRIARGVRGNQRRKSRVQEAVGRA